MTSLLLFAVMTNAIPGENERMRENTKKQKFILKSNNNNNNNNNNNISLKVKTSCCNKTRTEIEPTSISVGIGRECPADKRTQKGRNQRLSRYRGEISLGLDPLGEIVEVIYFV